VRRLILIAVLLLAGCGEQRKTAVDVVHPDAPAGFSDSTVTGVTFRRPTNWMDLEAAPPLEGGVRSKTATVAVWRYPRTEPLPEGRSALEEAKTRLLERVHQRSPTFTVRTSEVKSLAGVQGIEVTGRQIVAGFTVDVRSAHVFKDGAEVVVDAYAPPGDFARVDRTVFVPLIASLRLS
jgi:hypothetical protein